MPSVPARSTALILLLATAVVAGEAVAQKGRGGPPGQANRELPQARSPARHSRGADRRALSAAVRRVERRTGGRVLSAEQVPFDGRDVSRVKVVDRTGRVRTYMEDPGASRRPPAAPRRTRDDDD